MMKGFFSKGCNLLGVVNNYSCVTAVSINEKNTLGSWNPFMLFVLEPVDHNLIIQCQS